MPAAKVKPQDKKMTQVVVDIGKRVVAPLIQKAAT